MKKLLLLWVVLVSVSAAFGQERMLTVDDIFHPEPSKRVAFGGSPSRLVWAPDGRSFKMAREGRLVRVDAATGNEVRPYYDTQRFANALTTVAGIGAREADRLAHSIALRFNEDESAILLDHANDIWVYDVRVGSLKRLTNTPERELEADFSPDGRWVSFVRENNLYATEIATGETRQMTRDGSVTVHNGILVWVYEEELYGRGRRRGYWWSPDSSRIAFLRLDDAPVPKFVVTNDAVQPQVIESVNYPKAGDPNPLVRIGIADISRTSVIPSPARIPVIGDRLPASVQRIGDSVQFVDLSRYQPDDVLIGRVAWAPDSRNVIFQALNREQTFLDVNAAGLDGKTQKLFTETTPAWVEVYDNPAFLQDGSAVWQSARNGWKHLYHYDRGGKLIRQLTDGDWEVRSFHGIDEASGFAYFSATKDSHIAENIYRVPLKGGEIQRLTTGEGSHSASFNSDFTMFVHGWSDVNNPQQQHLMRSDGSLTRVINDNPVPVLKEFKLGTFEFMTVKTRDGFEMEAMMIRPPDFDPSKKYPVLQYTYAGPHAPAVRNSWGANRYMWHQMMAQKGYIIWICDNRTASGKGEQSVWPVYKTMGPGELRDIEDGVNYLKSLSYVDGDRIGIWGWSYGGFMTSFAMTHSKLFKAGIAGGSVTDWRLYDSIYTERYMSTPQKNPEGYDRTSVLNAAKNLSGRILLIHGMIDENVHQQNTVRLMNELQKHGHQFDFMLYPGQRHGIVNPAQQHHMYTLMTEFIERNL
ncbi:MAG: S9 family peptidase [Blastocatellia bacterium]|nr:S9 family peptidase [Blastocatellia bacterium]